MRSRKRGNVGRRSKGDRHTFTTRIPMAVAELLMEDSDRLEMSYSDFLANLACEKYGHPPVAAPESKDQDEDQMKLTA